MLRYARNDTVNAMTGLIITFLISAAIAHLVVVLLVRAEKGKLVKSVGKERQTLLDASAKLDQEMLDAIHAAEEMVPQHELVQITTEGENVRAQLSREAKKLEAAEARLKLLQTDIDQRENKHNEMKLGTEDSRAVVERLKAREEELAEEREQLTRALAEAKANLEKILPQAKLTDEQTELFAKLQSDLTVLEEHFLELADSYSVATERFKSLHFQHDEMEKEYKNLVEKQLSGADLGPDVAKR